MLWMIVWVRDQGYRVDEESTAPREELRWVELRGKKFARTVYMPIGRTIDASVHWCAELIERGDRRVERW